MTPEQRNRAEAIADLEHVARDLRTSEAKRFDLLARGYVALPPGEMAFRAYRADAALALGISEHRVDTLLGVAAALATDYQETAELLRVGTIGVAHVDVIVQAGATISNVVAIGVGSDAIAAAVDKGAVAATRLKEYEAAVLAFAVEETPNRLRPIARRLAERWAVEPIETRQAAEALKRRVTVVDCDDGMAELRAYLPAHQAYGLLDHLTRIGKAVKRKRIPAPALPPGVGGASSAGNDEVVDSRALAELRADAFYQLLSQDPFEAAAAAAQTPVGAELQGRVQLVVTEAGLERILAKHGGTVVRDTPAPPEGSVMCELQGYGPVDVEAARPLIGVAGRWDLATVCAHTGEVIRADSYRPVKAQERFLVARDGHCRFPGCNAPTYRAEVDHTLDAALGGPTATDNLAHLCRSHHTLKGCSDWAVAQRDGGVLEWTSPSGRTFVDRPPDRLPEQRAIRETSRGRTPESARAPEPSLGRGARDGAKRAGAGAGAGVGVGVGVGEKRVETARETRRASLRETHHGDVSRTPPPAKREARRSRVRFVSAECAVQPSVAKITGAEPPRAGYAAADSTEVHASTLPPPALVSTGRRDHPEHPF